MTDSAEATIAPLPEGSPARPVAAADLPEIAFADLASACPHARLAQARVQAPAAKVATPFVPEPFLMLTRASDVLGVADHPAQFLSGGHPQSRRFGYGYTSEADAVYDARGWPLRPALVWTDGAQHARVRRLVDKAFTPGKVARKVELIRGFVEELIAGFDPAAPVDFANDFAIQLPTKIITHELGLAPQMRELVQRATDYASFANDLAAPESAALPAAEAIVDLQAVLVAKFAALREAPEETILSDLVHATADGEPALTFDELMSTAVILLLGGSHTTSVMLSWAMYELAMQPELQARLRSEPEKIPDFIEELLRTRSTVTASYRRLAQDTQIHGQPIEAGACVMIRWDSANRDESRFAEPDRFDIDRANVRRHTAFGHGRHFCIGNGLARIELRETVAAMLGAYGTIALAEPVERAPALDNCALPGLKLSLTR